MIIWVYYLDWLPFSDVRPKQLPPIPWLKEQRFFQTVHPYFIFIQVFILGRKGWSNHDVSKSLVTIILLIHQKIFSEARIVSHHQPWSHSLKAHSLQRMVSQTCAWTQMKSLQSLGHKASIHTVQSSKESKKGNYWSEFLLFFNFLFLSSIIYVDMRSIEISSGPAPPQEAATVTGGAGGGAGK